LIDTPLVKPEKVQSEMPIDFGPYLAELSRRLKRNWAPPTEDRILPVTVTIVIDHSGRLVSASILKSSGSASADSAVIAASKLSAPYRPLPSGQKYPSITVDCKFDYNSGIQGQTVLRLPASEATNSVPISGFIL
jgi:TonB family protein